MNASVSVGEKPKQSLDVVNRLRGLREESSSFVISEVGSYLVVGVYQIVVGTEEPVDGPVGAKETAFNTEGFYAVEDVGANALGRPFVLAHAEAGDFTTDVVRLSDGFHALFPLSQVFRVPLCR